MSETSMVPPGWLLHSALGGGLLLLVAWLVMRRHEQPARRHFLGALGVSAALLAALLCLGPRWLLLPYSAALLPGPPESSSRAAGPEVFDGYLTLDPGLVADEVLDEPAALAVEEGPAGLVLTSVLAAVVPWLGAAWAVGAALFLGRFLLGHLALARLLCAARPAPPHLTRLLAGLANGARPLPRLLMSSQVQVPFSCGLLRPTVVLPADLCAADAPMLRWVFAHELTHLQRRDAWTACLFSLAQAVYFYLPWFWWLRRQVRLCQEYLADAAAARQAGSAEDYAQFLLSLTTKPAVPLGATGVTGNSSDLYRRVSMLLQSSNRVDRRCGWLWSLAATAGLVALAVFVSGVGLRADAATEDPAKVLTLEDVDLEVVLQPDEKDGKRRIYVISSKDGKVVTTVPSDPAAKDKKQAHSGELPKIVLPDVEEIIKKLPPGLSEEQLKQFREQWKKAHQDMRQAMEQIHKQLPKVQGTKQDLEATKKAIENLKALIEKEGKSGNRRALLEQALELYRKELTPQLETGRVWAATPAFQGRLALLREAGQGRLGIRVEKPSEALAEQLDLPKGQGLVITEVVANSAAAKAGLKVNDILLSLDGKTVPNDAEALVGMVNELKADATVDALVLRKGKKETVKGIQVAAAAGRRVILQEKVQAVPGLPGQHKIQVQPLPGVGPARIRVQAGQGGGQGVTMNITRTNDNFTASHKEGTVTVSVAGTVAGGKAKASSIEVNEGDKTTKFDSLDKVPEQHRDKVKKLLEALEKGGATKIEIKTPVPSVRPVPPAPPTPATPATPAKRPAGRDILYRSVQPGEAVQLDPTVYKVLNVTPYYEVVPTR